MKKFLAVLCAALLIALFLWLGLRIEQANRELAVAELLPRSTSLLIEMPDLNRTRDQWHQSDLDALWREPAIQSWLQKPLAQYHSADRTQATEDFLQLKPTRLFFALASFDNNEPKFIGGFHFDGSNEAAQRFMQGRETLLFGKTPSAAPQRATVNYQQNQITTITSGRLVLAEAYDRNWFFAANDLATLEALLDRADRRTKDNETLGDNELYTVAIKPLQTDAAALLFLEPQTFVEKLRSLSALSGQSAAQSQLQQFSQMKSVSASVGFDRGKIHDTAFIVMPRLAGSDEISRPSLGRADAQTFLYADWLAQWAVPGGMPDFYQQFVGSLTKAGVSAEDLRANFGDEMELIGQWPSDARWPQLLATLTVKDANRARKIMAALATPDLPGGAWTTANNNGTTLYISPGFGAFVPIHLAAGVSDRQLVLGTDADAVAASVAGKSAPGERLEKSAAFRDAIARVPAGETAFSYLDLRSLYAKIDAAARPLLLMGAAFSPSWAKNIDAAKFPPAEIITKHLSPAVKTQRYADNGYLSESVGPITLNQAGLLTAAAAAALYFQWTGLNGAHGAPSKSAPPPATASPAPSPIPSPSPI